MGGGGEGYVSHIFLSITKLRLNVIKCVVQIKLKFFQHICKKLSNLNEKRMKNNCQTILVIVSWWPQVQYYLCTIAEHWTGLSRFLPVLTDVAWPSELKINRIDWKLSFVRKIIFNRNNLLENVYFNFYSYWCIKRTLTVQQKTYLSLNSFRRVLAIVDKLTFKWNFEK